MKLETLQKAKEIEYEIARVRKLSRALKEPGNSVDVFDAKVILRRPEFQELIDATTEKLQKELEEL